MIFSQPLGIFWLADTIRQCSAYFGLRIPRHVNTTLEEKNLAEFGNEEGFAIALIVICSHFLAVFDTSAVKETDSQIL